MQPLLYEIGDLYSKNQLTVIQEHRFTQIVNSLLNDMEDELQIMNNSGKIDVLLACANGNYQTVGVMFLNLCLKEVGVRVEAITPGLPTEQLAEYVKDKKPKILGLSISLVEQLEEINKLIKYFESHHIIKPEIIVGGFALREGEFKTSGFSIFKGNKNEFIQLIREKVATSA